MDKKRSSKSNDEKAPNALGPTSEGKDHIALDMTVASDRFSSLDNVPTKGGWQPIDEATPFGVLPGTLMNLIDPKDPNGLRQLGGTKGLCEQLLVNIKEGVDSRPSTLDSTTIPSLGVMDHVHGAVAVPLGERRRVYGRNALPRQPPVSFLGLVWEVMHDHTLIMLMVAAAVSLAIGIYKDWATVPADLLRGTTEEHPYSWLEGLSILVAVILVVMVSAGNDYQKERQFRALNAKKEDRAVKLLRDGGKERMIGIEDVVVGDILMLEPGDILPADGVVLESFSLKCDESGATGESDAISKGILGSEASEPDTEHPMDPFVLSGTKVIEGVGKAIVIAVGPRSFHGKLMAGLAVEKEDTPLQRKLDDLAEKIAKLGGAMALLMLLSLLLKWVVMESLSEDGFPPIVQILDAITTILIQAITVLVVAVPEGLPMAVTIALAFATSQMIQDQNLVRVLAACETMGNATTICSDKTGTLTTNQMTVVAGILFHGTIKARTPKDLASWTLKETLSLEQQTLLRDALALNSTAFEEVSPDGSRVTPVGSKTEIALLHFLARFLSFTEVASLRASAPILQLIPFASATKTMSVRVALDAGGSRLYVKGASEIVLERSSRYLSLAEGVQDMNPDARAFCHRWIHQMASDGLRTIGVAYREDAHISTTCPDDPAAIQKNLVFIGVFGIEDPVRDTVPDAVRTCQRAGITVRMVTGDNATTAKAIASKCGILMRGGLTLEGPDFRALSEAELTAMVPRLQVLARSSPLDKQILVRKLKELNEVVAVTGDGTNDGPALKAADVGFAMGITGTEVAKEAASIILMDDDFTGIVKAVGWGRCVNDAVRKFLQFQLTVNVVAVLVAFVSAMVDPRNEGVLSAVQLLWVNLLMDTAAALALATDRPNSDLLLGRLPDLPNRGLVTFAMWRQIIGQALFQLTTLFLLLFYGQSIFHFASQKMGRTFIFNVFVLMQIANEFNSRILGSTGNPAGSLNPFHGLFSRWSSRLFLPIIFMSILGQFLIVTFGGAAFATVPLSPFYWLVGVLIACLSFPIALFIRALPDWRPPKPLERQPRQPITRERLAWQAAITDVRRGMGVFSALRRPLVRTGSSARLLSTSHHSLENQNRSGFNGL